MLKTHMGLIVWVVMATVMVLVCLHFRVDVLTLCICFLAWYGGVISTWAAQQELANVRRRRA